MIVLRTLRGSGQHLAEPLLRLLHLPDGRMIGVRHGPDAAFAPRYLICRQRVERSAALSQHGGAPARMRERGLAIIRHARAADVPHRPVTFSTSYAGKRWSCPRGRADVVASIGPSEQDRSVRRPANDIALHSGDILVVRRHDRIAGSEKITLETINDLAERGVNSRSLTESDIDTTMPTGRSLFGIVAVSAQLRVAAIRENTSVAWSTPARSQPPARRPARARPRSDALREMREAERY